jgi:uncharacterized protein (DUF2237 family)
LAEELGICGGVNMMAVMKKPLGIFSKEPMTGFYRNGYCDVGPEDTGNHSVAGKLPSYLRTTSINYTRSTSNTHRRFP